MDTDYIGKRITELRSHMNISERGMSLEIGRSAGYLQNITSGKAMPSWTEFFHICEYLNITPQEFFDDGVEDPAYLRELIADLKYLDAKQLEAVGELVRTMRR